MKLDAQLVTKFEYHLNLHYSQTRLLKKVRLLLFEYHLNLHYSQTPLYISTVYISLSTI